MIRDTREVRFDSSPYNVPPEKPSRLAGLFSFFRPGYDAAKSSNRRKSVGTNHRSEDNTLLPTSRKRLIENARDLARNFSIAAWAIRKHLEYVSNFRFQARMGSEQADAELEAFVGWWMRPENFDVREKHSLREYMRIVEASRTRDGDCFTLKTRTGHVQGIEGDRIRSAAGADGRGEQVLKSGRLLVQGVELTQQYQARRYWVHKRHRSGYGFELDRKVDREFIEHTGYFQRFDQVRGISPLAQAINPLRDSYECFDYALAKMKLNQLWGMAFYRTSGDALFDPNSAFIDGDTGRMEGDLYDVNPLNGPFMLELEPGDRAEFLEAKQPSSEFANFLNQVLTAALKALDIPYSFYDETKGNFYGNRSAWIMYQKTVGIKQEALVDLLNRLTFWRLQLAVIFGQYTPPAGMSLQDVRWQWIPDGTPWWRPLEEVRADVEACKAGFKTPGDVTMERYGRSWADNCRLLAEQQEIADSLGLALTVFTDEDGAARVANEDTSTAQDEDER